MNMCITKTHKAVHANKMLSAACRSNAHILSVSLLAVSVNRGCQRGQLSLYVRDVTYRCV